MGDRAKGYRQKLGSATYDTFIPFGTDGVLVDMASELNLEEEIRIGGDHYVTIVDESELSTIVTEYYNTVKAKIEDNTATNFYKVITHIESYEDNEDVTITCELWHYTDMSNGTMLKQKIIQITEDEDTGEVFVEEELQ